MPLPKKKALYEKARELFHRRARGEAQYVTPEESELREGGYVEEARREIMTGTPSVELEQKVSYGKELAGETGGQFFGKEEWATRKHELGLAKWKTTGYRFQAKKPPPPTMGMKVSDLLHAIRIPQRKKRHTTRREEAEAYGYPCQKRSVVEMPTLKGIGNFVFGTPEQREKHKQDRATRKAARELRKTELEAMASASYEKGLELGVRRRAYSRGYAEGRQRGKGGFGSGLEAALLGLSEGAKGMSSVFVGDSGIEGSILGFPTESRRPRKQKPKHRKSKSRRRRRR